MKKFFALVALFLAIGFAGGAEAHVVRSAAAQRAEATDVTGGQFITAASGHFAEQAKQQESDCCDTGFCFGSSHCHHCGGANALLTPAPTSLMVSESHDKFGSLSDTMPVLSLSYAIIDPPRA